MAEQVNGVAVAGAGLAGLTLAAALRARRAPAEVLTVRLGGQGDGDRGLCLWGGALAALDRIGLGEAVRAHGAPLERVHLWSAAWRPLLGVSAREAPGLAGVAIRASTLLDLLRDACAEVPIQTGRRVLGYGEDDQGVLIDLETGGPVRAQAVVGADGARSAIRLQCLDDGPPAYCGDSVFEGIGPAAPWLTPGTLHLYWGRYGLRAAAVALPQQAGGAGASAWWVDLETGPVVAGAAAPLPRKHELARFLAEVPGPIPELVAATAEEAIRRSDALARRSPSRACSGRVTLIGDAAHPLPAAMRLGASLAVEDAVALADALAAEPDPLRAFRRYEQGRRARVAWAMATLWRLRALEARFSAAATWVRDAAVGHLPQSAVRLLLSRLTAGDGTDGQPRAPAKLRGLQTRDVRP